MGMIESKELLKYVSYEEDQNILKGIIIQDDYMSPLVIFFHIEFWTIFFFPWSAIVQVKVE